MFFTVFVFIFGSKSGAFLKCLFFGKKIFWF
uniref:Uncharacterized protein n=1 Tax=Anguilla anguilla TaxID=7936 RepID=A0A0E9TJ06_ANGAN